MFSEGDITSLLIFIIIYSLMYIMFRKPAGIPPGPAFTLPVLGDLPQFAASKGGVICALRKLRKKHGQIYSFYMGRELAIIVTGYAMIHKVAVERGLQFCGRPKSYLTDLISKGMGLAFSTSGTWKKQRSFVNMALQKLGMKKKSHEWLITEEVNAFISILESGEPVDIKDYIRASAAKVAFTSILGKRYKHDDPLFESFLRFSGNEIKLLPKASILLNCLPLLKYLPGDPLQTQTIQNDFQKFEKLVNENVIEPILENPPDQATTFAEMYIEKIKENENMNRESVFTFEQMKMVIGDMLVEGSETVPTTIRWSIVYLVNFPEIQNKLQRHIDEVIDKEQIPCLDDRNKLPYVEAFISEVLRCANVLPLGLPRADLDGNDSYLEGFRIPKGTAIMFDFDSVFMDPKIFQQPEKFNPDRFLNEDGAFEKPKEFIPFALGRRVCIGEQIANWELFLYMVNLLKTFTFLPASDGTLPKIAGSIGITFEPKQYMIGCIRRK